VEAVDDHGMGWELRSLENGSQGAQGVY
jgi:hypothetical protein